jgi:nucleotide-binding universal stress UspA family protein
VPTLGERWTFPWWGDDMSGYRTVLVGTDGSESSLRAVSRAGGLAADTDAKLIIATGYFRDAEDSRAADVLKEDAYMVKGNAPIYAVLREAHARAAAAGATNVEERSIEDAPVHALVHLAEEVKADLLVVGNVGLNARRAILGRLFSVAGQVSTRAKSDVLIVHTTD